MYNQYILVYIKSYIKDIQIYFPFLLSRANVQSILIINSGKEDTTVSRNPGVDLCKPF